MPLPLKSARAGPLSGLPHVDAKGRVPVDEGQSKERQ